MTLLDDTTVILYIMVNKAYILALDVVKARTVFVVCIDLILFVRYMLHDMSMK
jgi:hypothetical protein